MGWERSDRMPGCRVVLMEISMRRKSRRFKMGIRVACVIASLVVSVGAGAFTFADGTSARCVAGGKTVRMSSGFVIIWNAERLKALPPEVHDYLFFHECAHARVPTADELKANCAGLQDMRAAGRAGFAVESRLGAFYGPRSDYWTRTLKCADVAATSKPP